MIVKPESKGTGKPYIQIYANSKDKITWKPLVSAATVFVSQAWRYSFYDVMVDVMDQYAGGFALLTPIFGLTLTQTTKMT